MPIKTYVTACDLKNVSSLKTEETEILTTLGADEEALAVQLQELFGSVVETITPTLQSESQLTIEITGSVSLKVQGGVKYLFFNVGGEAGKTGTMKVVLSTTLKPAS
jgi:hypothetical protein